VLDLLSSGLALVAPDGAVTFVNRAWQSLFGTTPGECVGRTLRAACPQLAQIPAQDSPVATLADGAPRRAHLPVRDGIYEIMATRNASGFVVIEVKVSRELELAERSAEAEDLRRLARAMAEENDFDALLRLLSEDALRQCGGERSAVVKIHPREGEVVATAGSANVLRGTRFPLEGSLTARAISQRAMVSESVDAARFPEHQQIGALQQAGPVLITPLIAHDRVLGVLSVSRSAGSPDFSARDRYRLQAIADHASLGLWKLRLLDEAQAASQAKSDFMATMSHELRTPLTALTGYGELLAEEIVGPLNDSQADVVDRMRSVTHHLAVVIDEILTFSNLEAGRETARFDTVDVSVLIRSVLAIVEPQARHRGITFEVSTPERLEMVTDPDKTRQILVNLVGNAIKFTDAGRVSLVVTGKGSHVAFAVEDTGIGIRAADRPRLFQAFSQLDSGLTRRHGGTGLGLYISQRLALLLGGCVSVDSEFGRGSTFTLLLPIRLPERA
jgi:signal transduction histidine kinase